MNAANLHDMIPAWVDGVLCPVEKLSVHEQGLKHKAVSVFLICEGKVLIQQRALGKYHTPGLWANTCCTHPLWNEESSNCAVRRLDDELGITGVAPTFRTQVEYRADVGGGLTEHEVVDIFVAVVDADLRITPNPDEVMDYRWIDYDSLRLEVQENPERFTPWLKVYLHDHAQALFGELLS